MPGLGFELQLPGYEARPLTSTPMAPPFHWFRVFPSSNQGTGALYLLTLTVLVTTIDALQHFETG